MSAWHFCLSIFFLLEHVANAMHGTFVFQFFFLLE